MAMGSPARSVGIPAWLTPYGPPLDREPASLSDYHANDLEFVRALFDAIAETGRDPGVGSANVRLAPYDLFHGHVMRGTFSWAAGPASAVPTASSATRLIQEQDSRVLLTGSSRPSCSSSTTYHTEAPVSCTHILFHAKEYPKEYSSGCVLLPVGHEKAGGDQDPRLGSHLSIEDQDFDKRNFLYSPALDRKQMFLVDVKHKDFPGAPLMCDGVSGTRYFSVDEKKVAPEQVGLVDVVFAERSASALPEATPVVEKIVFVSHNSGNNPKQQPSGETACDRSVVEGNSAANGKSSALSASASSSENKSTSPGTHNQSSNFSPFSRRSSNPNLSTSRALHSDRDFVEWTGTLRDFSADLFRDLKQLAIGLHRAVVLPACAKLLRKEQKTFVTKLPSGLYTSGDVLTAISAVSSKFVWQWVLRQSCKQWDGLSRLFRHSADTSESRTQIGATLDAPKDFLAAVKTGDQKLVSHLQQTTTASSSTWEDNKTHALFTTTQSESAISILAPIIGEPDLKDDVWVWVAQSVNACRIDLVLRVTRAEYRRPNDDVLETKPRAIPLSVAQRALDYSDWVCNDARLGLEVAARLVEDAGYRETLSSASEETETSFLTTTKMSWIDVFAKQAGNNSDKPPTGAEGEFHEPLQPVLGPASGALLSSAADRAFQPSCSGASVILPDDDINIAEKSSQETASPMAMDVREYYFPLAATTVQRIETEILDVAQAEFAQKSEERFLRQIRKHRANCCDQHADRSRDMHGEEVLNSKSSSTAEAGAAPQSQSPNSDRKVTLDEATDGTAWCILVGGESGGAMVADKNRTRPGKYLGGHCSLQNIGRMYEKLLPWFGADRIIVVTQLQETLDWLEEVTSSTESCQRLTGKATPEFFETMQRKKRETYKDCEALLQNGGADYDYEDVNVWSLLSVLRNPGSAATPASSSSSSSAATTRNKQHPTKLFQEATTSSGGSAEDCSSASSASLFDDSFTTPKSQSGIAGSNSGGPENEQYFLTPYKASHKRTHEQFTSSAASAGRKNYEKRRAKRKTLPRNPGSVFLLINTHGNTHPAVKGKEEAWDEWYCHFPYPTAADQDHIYSIAATQGFVDEEGAASGRDSNVSRSASASPSDTEHQMSTRNAGAASSPRQDFGMGPGTADFVMNITETAANHSQALNQQQVNETSARLLAGETNETENDLDGSSLSGSVGHVSISATSSPASSSKKVFTPRSDGPAASCGPASTAGIIAASTTPAAGGVSSNVRNKNRVRSRRTSVDWGAPKYRFRLYSQQLFQAFHDLTARSPNTQVITLYQFCLSGGFANFFTLKSYQRYFDTLSWPLFVMVTSGQYEPALGTFASFYCEQLVKHLEFNEKHFKGSGCSATGTTAAKTEEENGSGTSAAKQSQAQSPSGVQLQHDLSLKELFEETRLRYHHEHGELGQKRKRTNAGNTTTTIPGLERAETASSSSTYYLAAQELDRENSTNAQQQSGLTQYAAAGAGAAMYREDVPLLARDATEINPTQLPGSEQQLDADDPVLSRLQAANSRAQKEQEEAFSRKQMDEREPLSVGTLSCYAGMRTPRLSMEDVPISTMVNVGRYKKRSSNCTPDPEPASMSTSRVGGLALEKIPGGDDGQKHVCDSPACSSSRL
ncbi:unnamed protein product [Amoebophrya sp. A120]|nr:unnamed protein product [Amoebophrya sp. A120]|eukprot:GSA120T00005568001.1